MHIFVADLYEDGAGFGEEIAGEGVSPAELATCLRVLKRMTENLSRETQRLSGSPTA